MPGAAPHPGLDRHLARRRHGLRPPAAKRGQAAGLRRMIDVDLKKTVPGFSLDVAFRNAEGVTALFGRSGSGKSMTLGLIAGLVQPDQGHVRIGDAVLVDTGARRSVADAPAAGWTGVPGFAAVPASVRAPQSAVRSLVRAAPRRHRRLRRRGRDAGIGALLDRRPARLSGGERQRSRSVARCSPRPGCCCSTSPSPRSTGNASSRSCR